MVLESRKRREHLSEEDLQKNRAIIDSFSKGNTQMIDNENNPAVEVNRRPSLAPPAAPAITWDQYCSTPAGDPPLLARRIVSKTNSKQFKAELLLERNGNA